ncbi:MAG: YaaR family protein [Eubacteriales bacterium]
MTLRINRTDQSKALDRELQPLSDKAKSDFNSILAHTHKLQNEELKLFLLKLEDKGNELVQTLSIKDLLEFKNMIKDFLKSTFGQSRQIQEESCWDPMGQPRIMARVTKINKVLEELGQQVMDKNTEPMKILAKIGEIKGLIVDLTA